MTLQEAFTSIEDPRNPSGLRYSLSSIFTLLLAGLISGNDNLLRISLWFRTLSKKSAEALGFCKGRPSVATLSNILRKVSTKSVDTALGSCFSDGTHNKHVAIDGKSLRGSARDTVPIVHLLSAFVVENQNVIKQLKMEEGENEITTALRLLSDATIEGGIITGDAIFAQKKSVKQS